MLGFQNLMSQFLQTQQRVMESYFRGTAGAISLPQASFENWPSHKSRRHLRRVLTGTGGGRGGRFAGESASGTAGGAPKTAGPNRRRRTSTSRPAPTAGR